MLEPNKNIVNVIIYCKPEEREKLTSEFSSKNYPVDYQLVVQGEPYENLTNAIDEYTTASFSCTFT
jgi:hypothetical protein